MIGTFDWNNDRCFEVHAGTLPRSHKIGKCLKQVINAYDLDLTFDFIDDETAYTFSDHHPFWLEGVPGVMVFENGFYQPGETCGKTDRNYAYHTTADTLVYINQSTGFSILRASLAAAAYMALPLGACISESIEIKGQQIAGNTLIFSGPLPKAAFYKVWQFTGTRWLQVGETVATRWMVPSGTKSKIQWCQVTAETQGGCQSLPGNFPLQ